jgi:5-methyltetrahydropteroyltriglutamate--homocysteine methyltransferase
MREAWEPFSDVITALARLINAARGGLVVDEDLIAALKSGRVAAVGPDVFEGEPKLHPGYVALKNTFLSPHMNMIVPTPSVEEYRKFASVRVDALNQALTGLPEDRVRFHCCWGSWHGPHTHDLPLKHIVDLMLRVKAGAYSVEAANPRHEHEWKVWRDVKLPEGKILIPGVVSHASNVVEHPELVADRIVLYAGLVGRENVIAGTDCGLGFRVHPQIAWAKLKTLAEGAALASKQLWT